MEYITVNILGKEYQISCPLEFREELIKATTYVDHKMLEIRNKGKIISFEGMLITAAINIAYEVIQKEHQNMTDTQHLVKNLTSMKDKLNHAIKKPIPSNKLKFEYNNNNY
ncbi:MAG: cell division protein ZapA [Gammaproteobacteria bacterium]